MFSNSFFTISDFAKLMGISRQTLIYYDRIGLFKPVRTLDNGYRLYSRNQINVISLISMLGEMGVPLKEIKDIVDNISPDTALEILRRQRGEAEEKLRRLRTLESMISLRIEQITVGKALPETTVPEFSVIDVAEDIPLYVGEDVDCPLSDIPDDFVIEFYARCEEQGFPLIFSSGQTKSRENILSGRTDIVSGMCFTLKDADGANSAIPRGRYVVGHVHGDYGATDDIYKDMLAFIAQNGLRVAGDAYEEYLLDELAESDPDKFVMRVMIGVE